MERKGVEGGNIKKAKLSRSVARNSVSFITYKVLGNVAGITSGERN